MKLDDLLNAGPEVFEKMSDKELEDFFRPMLTLTRPDDKMLARALENHQKKAGVMPNNRKTLSADALSKAKALGVDLSFLLKNAKKRR